MGRATDVRIDTPTVRTHLATLTEHLGATRGMILWAGADGWQTIGSASPRDDLLIDLVRTLDGPVDGAETTELGAVGRRLAATGLSRLSVAVLDELGPVVACFEEPDESLDQLPPAPRWLAQLLAAEARLESLDALRGWLDEGVDVTPGVELPETLEQLLWAFAVEWVTVVRPARRGVTVTTCRREDDRIRTSEEVAFDLDWSDVTEDPVAALSTRLHDSAGEPLVGRGPSVDTIMVAPPSPVLEPHADIVATELGQVLRSARRLERSGDRARMEERTRLATLLHEELSQRLATISVRIDILASRSRAAGVVDDLDEVRAEVVEAVESLRSAIYELTPPEPSWVHLDDGLSRFARDHGAQRGLEVEFEVRGEPRPIEPDQVSLVFAAVQEALTNVAKHAGTRQARVELAFGDEVVAVTVTDEGRGMREDASEQAGWGHQGLGVLRTRARLADADLQITGIEGEGTTMVLSVPTTDAAADD